MATAALRDGQYQDKALGYAGDIDVTVIVREGKIADIRLKHEEKIDQNACVLIPQRIIDAQSLQVDGISGATVTKDAIVHGVYRCLQTGGTAMSREARRSRGANIFVRFRKRVPANRVERPLVRVSWNGSAR